MDKNIHKLFAQYLEGTCTKEETEQLVRHFGVKENEALLKLMIHNELMASHEKNDAVTRITNRVDQRVFDKINLNNQPKKLNKIRKIKLHLGIASSAAILLLVGFLWLQRNTETNTKIALSNIQTQKDDVLPGTTTAQLILSDGKTVQLGQRNASLQEMDGTKILGKDGALIYTNEINNNPTTLLLNTLTIPKGGIYSLTLPDGTQVWLNSASSITFPTKFAKNFRNVEITGEVYFEVAHNKNTPFKVSVQGKIIKVLGTHFNVNAYDEVKTTLFEGIVQITSGGSSTVLNPGEEALMSENGISIFPANFSKANSWRNGKFYFVNESIESILQEVSRWYNVEVDLSQLRTKKKFSGTLKRTLKLSEVLNVLHILTNHDFKLQNKKISII